MPTIAPPAQVSNKYPLSRVGRVETSTNCSIADAWNATENNVALDIDATGDLTAEIYFSYRLPSDFKKFAGGSDDLVLRAIQDATSGDTLDIAITVDVVDSSGTDADDDSVDDQLITGSWATYDCAITAGSFSAGDVITVKLTVQAKSTDTAETGDGALITQPELKYIPN